MHATRTFRQWSFAAQPDGYPDVIDFRRLADGKAAAEVIAGRADVAGFSGTAAVRADLARRYPVQFKEQLLAETSFEYLNIAMAPFDDIRVRQALYYAVDRNRLVAIRGATARFRVTCQVLPPNFPSYRWYCPYTTGARDGRYHGPDLAKAKELVRLSGTRGMAVTIRGTTEDHELNSYVAKVLRQLGYPVKLRQVSPTLDSDLLRALGHVQIASAPGRIADYPAGSNFYNAVFSCKTAMAGAGWYCNPQVERVAAEAHQAQVSDPARASRLWTEVDRLITDDAPVVALGNATSQGGSPLQPGENLRTVPPGARSVHGNPSACPQHIHVNKDVRPSRSVGADVVPGPVLLGKPAVQGWPVCLDCCRRCPNWSRWNANAELVLDGSRSLPRSADAQTVRGHPFGYRRGGQ